MWVFDDSETPFHVELVEADFRLPLSDVSPGHFSENAEFHTFRDSSQASSAQWHAESTQTLLSGSSLTEFVSLAGKSFHSLEILSQLPKLAGALMHHDGDDYALGQDHAAFHDPAARFHSGRDSDLTMTAAGTADNNDDIIVIGYRYDSGGMGEGGGGGGGLGDFQDPATSIQNPTDDGAPAQAEVALPTPCTETTFSAPGATTQEANQAALDASNAIAARNDETYEFSSLIYSLNGEVGWTAPFTNHDTQQVNWAGGIGGVPDGAIIIGVLHNHPDEPTITDTIPSGSGGLDGMDWDSYHELVDYNRDHTIDLPRGITVDQNLILYIYSNEDHKTHTYDNTDESQTSPSCTLQ